MPPQTTKNIACRAGGGGVAHQGHAPDSVSDMPKDVVPQLQALLDAAGSRGCQVKQGAYSTLENGWLSFSCENVGARECLICEGETHVSNNASLHVGPDGQRVHYKCLAPDCLEQGYRYIGDLKLEPDDALSATSASPGQGAAEMEVEGDVQPDFNHQDASDCASEAASACSRTSMEQLLGEVVRELALIHPVADEADRDCILERAAWAAGEQPEDCIKALQAAALEFSYRSLNVPQITKYAEDKKLFRVHQHKVMSFFKPGTSMSTSSSSAASSSSSSNSTILLSSSFCASNSSSSSPNLPARCSSSSSSGSSSSSNSGSSSSSSSSSNFRCLHALEALRTERLSAEGWFKYEAEAEPYRNVYGKSMTADEFLRRIDTNATHALLLVLCARHLWPEAQDRFHHFIKFNFKRENVHGLDSKIAFAKVWGFAREAAIEGFNKFISSRMHIMAQPFLWEVLPSLLNSIKVARYQLCQDTLSFWLDSPDYLKSSVEYSFDFCTGNITSSKGEGIIHRMYSVKRFFQDDCNINLMADVLAEQGIGNLMIFDEDDKHWRVYDGAKGIWVHPKAACDPEVIVSRFIVRLLRPIKQAEDFFNKEVMWVDSGVDVDEGPGEDLSVEPSDSVSQVGSKRARSQVKALYKATVRKSKVARALHTYSQNPRQQAEIVKVLATRIIVSFTGKQKPYLLCCPSGLLDLRTGKVTRKQQADDYITQVCKEDYDPLADLKPAEDFFKQYFPLEAYPDQAEIVFFLQQFLGYCLTLETEQQFCLVIYGKGSNGKSLLNKILHEVLGEDLCKVLPVESLAKARGQNNDSLHDARFARVVTMEESHWRAKLNTATFKNLVCGEVMTNKTMYKTESNFKPGMKLIFFLNELLADLKATDEAGFSMLRRTAFLNFQTIFVDELKAIEKQQADEI